MRAGISGALVAAALVMMPLVAGAQALPGFRLVTRDGATVGSDALPATGHWLLIYVVPGSAPSDRLIQALGETWSADTAPRIAIVVGADEKKAQAYLADKGGTAMAAATWYADPGNEAWVALGFQGTLGVAGVVSSTIDWKVDGVIDDPSVLAPLTRAWLERGVRP